MGEVAEQLARITVHALSPDHGIEAAITHGSQLAVRFQPGRYDRYDADELRFQFSRLLTDLWQDRERAVDQALSVAGITRIENPEDAWDRQTRRYLADVATVVPRGESQGGYVRIQVKASEWELRLHPDALRDLAEDELVCEVLTAVAATRYEAGVRVQELKHEHFERIAVANEAA